MSFTVKGKVIEVGEIATFGASGFQKSVFVVELPGKFPQKVPFELHKERCNIVLKTDIGKEIEVHFELRGSEYNGKYYSQLVAWKVERGEQLPVFEEKWLSGAIAKIKTGEQTVSFFQEKYTLTVEQFAAMKSAEPTLATGDSNDLPF